jgi:hypothetical protein
MGLHFTAISTLGAIWDFVAEASCTTIWNDVQVYEIFDLTRFIIVVTELPLSLSLRGKSGWGSA